MAQSQTDICNSALQRVGANRILNITDNSEEARSCSVAYDSNRRAELRKHYWRFALKRAVISPDANPPLFGFKYAFTLPADCLRILIPHGPYLDWSLEGRKLLTNDMNSPWLGTCQAAVSSMDGGVSLSLRYVADIEDASQFDAAFYDVLAISLALDICERLTQSNQKKASLEQEYQAAVLEARKVNAFETLPAQSIPDGFLLVRYR